MTEKKRCGWVDLNNPLYVEYHDQEWGVPSHDDRHLFEMLILEGAQAGLSWSTILNKREGYRRAFDRFDPECIARYDEAKRAELLADAGIVRNRLKIDSTIGNAKAYLAMHEAGETLDEWLWDFVDGSPKVNAWEGLEQVPAVTSEAEKLSKALKKKGFRFVGPTICYAFMQAVGMVNDHTTDCFCYSDR